MINEDLHAEQLVAAALDVIIHALGYHVKDPTTTLLLHGAKDALLAAKELTIDKRTVGKAINHICREYGPTDPLLEGLLVELMKKLKVWSNHEKEEESKTT